MASLFSKPSAPPAPTILAPAPVVAAPPVAAPAVAAPAPMPTPDDAAAKLAKRKSIAASQQRGGRAATILSDARGGNDQLG